MAPRLSPQLILVAPTAFTTAMDRAYALALRSPRRAYRAAYEALVAATKANRPDLAWRAQELHSAIGGVL